MIIKVVALNLWFNGGLLDKALEFLQAQDADIVILQEVLNGQNGQTRNALEALKTSVSLPYSAYEEMFILKTPHGNVSLGNAVLSKFPIKSSSKRFFVEPTLPVYKDIAEHWAIMPRMLQHVIFESPVGEINVFNMHGVWDLDGDSFSPARQKMSLIIIEETKDKPNVILAGDSNAKASNPAMLAIEKHLKSVFGQELKSTFNMRRKTSPGYASATVDLMYVSPGIQVLSRECPDVDISDHLPIAAELEISQAS